QMESMRSGKTLTSNLDPLIQGVSYSNRKLENRKRRSSVFKESGSSELSNYARATVIAFQTPSRPTPFTDEYATIRSLPSMRLARSKFLRSSFRESLSALVATMMFGL